MGYIANYGYRDGSGDWFIRVDTNKCETCENRGCIEACPEKILVLEEDDYDDLVLVVKEGARHKIKYLCTVCKSKEAEVPCIAACGRGGITHLW
ncbi:MAG: hypothetical protein WA118_10520 [Carboxydocellales bacterium]